MVARVQRLRDQSGREAFESDPTKHFSFEPFVMGSDGGKITVDKAIVEELLKRLPLIFQGISGQPSQMEHLWGRFVYGSPDCCACLREQVLQAYMRTSMQDVSPMMQYPEFRNRQKNGLQQVLDHVGVVRGQVVVAKSEAGPGHEARV